MTNVRPGYMKADEYGSSWDEEYEAYVEVFKAMGIIQ